MRRKSKPYRIAAIGRENRRCLGSFQPGAAQADGRGIGIFGSLALYALSPTR